VSNARQLRKNEETKKKILDCAREIIDKDGVDGLSIRKITNAMDYSPGIIYHYFKDKQEIQDYLLQEGYKRILASIKLPAPDLSPDDAIRFSIKNYIVSALQWKSEWKAFMFRSEDSILAYTSVLEEKSSEKRQALAELCNIIERGVTMGLFAQCDVELTAQALWSAMFGILARLIIEKNITETQTNKLINRQIDILIRGILQ